jgi:(2R)-sulfolactate sulfo-lyase subunit beta
MSVSQMVANYDMSKIPSRSIKGRKIDAPGFRGPVAKKALRAATKDFFQGWRRENGRVGVRNHVLLLPLDDLSNAACEAVANNVKGVLAVPHAYGRLQFGADLDLHFRTLIGTGSNPNIAAVIVIGIEDGWTKIVVDGIARTGKPVVGFGIEGHGDIATIARASYVAKDFVQWASELQREKCPISDLWVSTKCGESDTTTGLSSCQRVSTACSAKPPRSQVPSICARHAPQRPKLANAGTRCGKPTRTM